VERPGVRCRQMENNKEEWPVIKVIVLIRPLIQVKTQEKTVSLLVFID
jgi:hypothetical protein